MQNFLQVIFLQLVLQILAGQPQAARRSRDGAAPLHGLLNQPFFIPLHRLAEGDPLLRRRCRGRRAGLLFHPAAQLLLQILRSQQLAPGNGKGTLVRSMAGQLKLLATADGHTASCVMARSAKADDGYDGREDAPLLVESEEGAGVAVFTVAGGRALTVQQFRAATRIPVGFYMRRTGDVTLAFGAAKGLWQDWRLTDRQTGKSYPIGGKVTLRNVSTGTGRFYLEKAN